MRFNAGVEIEQFHGRRDAPWPLVLVYRPPGDYKRYSRHLFLEAQLLPEMMLSEEHAVVRREDHCRALPVDGL